MRRLEEETLNCEGILVESYRAYLKLSIGKISKSEVWRTDSSFHERWQVLECLSRTLAHTLDCLRKTCNF